MKLNIDPGSNLNMIYQSTNRPKTFHIPLSYFIGIIAIYHRHLFHTWATLTNKTLLVRVAHV